MERIGYSIIFILAFVVIGLAQTDAEKEAIKATAMDYMEGWYEGNAERMERALHPELAKRMFSKDEKGRSVFNHMGAMRLVQSTRKGYGKDTPKDKQRKDVKILDVFENVASVRCDMSDWIDYMHIAKVDGKWVIVNVLWELRPKTKE
jgi:Putative lumazine-binding